MEDKIKYTKKKVKKKNWKNIQNKTVKPSEICENMCKHLSVTKEILNFLETVKDSPRNVAASSCFAAAVGC